MFKITLLISVISIGVLLGPEILNKDINYSIANTEKGKKMNLKDDSTQVISKWLNLRSDMT